MGLGWMEVGFDDEKCVMARKVLFVYLCFDFSAMERTQKGDVGLCFCGGFCLFFSGGF